jgi:anti-sigma factor RsiW
MRAKREESAGLPDRALWRQSCATDSVDGEAEAERYLDLAGFADGRLDPDDQERVADWLDRDPAAAADVAAARMLGQGAQHGAQSEDASATIIARACALVGGATAPRARGGVMPFRRRLLAASPPLRGWAGWGSAAAAVMVAGWLGFTLGMDTSQSLDAAVAHVSDEGSLHELLDPPAGLMRDLLGATQT